MSKKKAVTQHQKTTALREGLTKESIRPKKKFLGGIQFRLLPIMLAVVAVSFGFKVGAVIAGSSNLEGLLKSSDKNSSKNATDKKKASSTEDKMPPGKAEIDQAMSINPENRMEARILGELKKAQDGIAKKYGNDNLNMQQRVLEVTEKRIDEKVRQLQALQASLRELTAFQKQESERQFSALVKVYETMKPKDAGRIFEKLDLSVQLAVSAQMKPRKMASILAKMDSKKAKTLTMAIAERNIAIQKLMEHSAEFEVAKSKDRTALNVKTIDESQPKAIPGQ